MLRVARQSLPPVSSRAARMPAAGWALMVLALLLAGEAIDLAHAQTDASSTPAVAGDELRFEPPLPEDHTSREWPRLDFALSDSHGTTHRLSDLSDSSIVVVVFVGVDCPLVRLYAPRLAELAAEYAPRGVAYLAVDSNRQDSPAALSEFADKFRLGFPLLHDPAQTVADQFGAERTPEVFVLDAQRRIRYRGRVDDQYGFDRGDGKTPPINYQRPAPERHDLREALDEILAGGAVSVPRTEAPGCLIGRVREPDPASPVTWARDVAPIFERRCRDCHRPGQIGPFALETFDQAAGWAEMIAEVVRERRMPPWHADPQYGSFANDARLADDERSAILRWVEHGAPEGDPADRPPPRTFTDGWLIPSPDLILYMADEPFAVPAEGIVEYQYFVVDPQLERDVWVRAAEARPGNPAVVHHINVFVLRPESVRGLSRAELAESWSLQGEMLCGFVPGMRPIEFPTGIARHVPAGSLLVFQLHYTPIGEVQFDRSYLGLVFESPDEVRHVVRRIPAMHTGFEIPPDAGDHIVELWHPVLEDSLALAFLPHMHLRGKAFRYVARYPSGVTEILLDVPRYDFNWQTTYLLRVPKHLPRGTQLQMIARFDNSAENLSNPDPSATVRWGEQSWEEMMIGYIDLMPVAAKTAASNRPRPWGLTAAALAFVALLLAASAGLYRIAAGQRRSHRSAHSTAGGPTPTNSTVNRSTIAGSAITASNITRPTVTSPTAADPAGAAPDPHGAPRSSQA